ncbi:hypothetical protein [Thiocapsa rosea]|uniref:hypothetical protein n=1 Tax=Thiocapsa rosea TaxID=69360 RepID=UPI0011C458BC|nr:hypothetical protein [Thiocapsa rosea]
MIALVVLLIAGAQVNSVCTAGPVLPTVLPVFIACLLLAALLAWLLAPLMRLRFDAGCASAFSLGARNSFVVLPFALALPTGWKKS